MLAPSWRGVEACLRLPQSGWCCEVEVKEDSGGLRDPVVWQEEALIGVDSRPACAVTSVGSAGPS